MQSTMELADLDELVEHLDTQISQVDVAQDNAQSPSLLVCSLANCGGHYSYYWYC